MTDKEKAEYYDEWKDYFEPLARVRSEVIKVIPIWVEAYRLSTAKTFMDVMIDDAEVRCELENLIQTIINEIEDLEQTAPIQGGQQKQNKKEK